MTDTTSKADIVFQSMLTAQLMTIPLDAA